MEIQKIKTAKLKGNNGQVAGLPSNPRLIKDEKFKKLVKSIQDDPEMMELREVIVYDNHGEYVVIAGNMRLKVCKELGIKEVPCKVLPPDTPLEKLKAYTIKDNVSFGEHDFDMLQQDWDLDLLVNFGVDLPDAEITIQPEAEEDDFDVPEGGSETDIVLGDLFEIGRHKLLCGSSTEVDTWARLFGDQKANLVVTDPPYNVSYVGKTKDALKIENDRQSDAGFYEFLFDFYTALGSYTHPGGAWYVWHADSEGANFRRAMADAGIMVKQCLIWVKNSMVMGRQDYHWQHEPCLYGWKEGAAHKWYSDRKQTTVLNFTRPQRNAEHPTMKPVELIAYQVKNSSAIDDIVADGFGGSGTTMVTCEQLERTCYMMELDPRYCQVIVDRMKKLNSHLIIKRNGEIY